MRKYQAAWEKLKKTKHLSLRVPPQLVRQVKKAIIKEKDQDTVFKLLNEHEETRLEIEYDKEAYALSFVLKCKFGIEDLEVS